MNDDLQQEGDEISAAFMGRAHQAKRLVLQQCSLSEKAMQSLRQVIQGNSQLESISLENCTVTPRGLHNFMLGPLESVPQSSLFELTVEGCGMTDNHAR